MRELTFMAHTKRRSMTKARAARIFLEKNGRCYCCHQQIKTGEAWIVEHPDPLGLGGSDEDEDLHPAHERCRRVKDKKDVADIAARNRSVTSRWKGKRKRKMGYKLFDGTPVRPE